MFTLLELFGDDSRSAQIFYAFLADVIFFSSLYFFPKWYEQRNENKKS